MYRSLLVPLDGSAFGEQALPMALAVARRHGAVLQVVHVHEPIPWAYAEPGGSYDEALDRAVRELGRAYLDAVVSRLAAVAGVPLSSALLGGLAADAIAQQVVATGADLLVMTTHGRGPLTRFWFGSVADALVRQASVPILFVRPQEAALDLAREPALLRVLIPLDGSELAEEVLEPALALGTAAQAAYTVLRVVEQMTPASYDPAGGRASGLRESLRKQLQELDRRSRAEAQGYLEHLAERLRARSLTVQTRVVSHEQPAAAILNDASAHGADLIALATHGRGGLKRLLIGSVADKVLRGGTTPVLVCRPLDRSAQAGK
jgi:nucleotide-binding universal stress UspA family protein